MFLSPTNQELFDDSNLSVNDSDVQGCLLLGILDIQIAIPGKQVIYAKFTTKFVQKAYPW